MINHDERLIFLSTFIGVGELVRKWIDSKSTNQQPLLSLILSAEFDVHQNQIIDWKNQLISASSQAFDQSKAPSELMWFR
nr:hypothetical protein [Acinetobacter sp. TTH0-4]